MKDKAWLKWARISIGLCLLLTMGYAHDDPLRQPVTYDQPAQTVKQLLTALSRQTGVRLFAPSPIDSEIVLVIVREMPLKELMDHLATITDGEWFKQPDGSYHLVRTPKIIKERRQQDDEQILQDLKRALERKEIKSLLEPLNEQQARQHRDKIKELMREIEAQDLNAPLWNTPYGNSIREQTEPLSVGRRLILRLIQRMDLRRLLEIPVGERRVFSNMRGRFLLPLGFAVEPILQQYAREHRLVYELWTHPTEGFDQQQIDRFNRRYSYLIDDYRLRQKPPSSPLTRVYLAVHRQAPYAFECTATVVTEDLKQSFGWGTTYWSLWALKEEQESNTAAQTSKPSETPAQSVERVEWSERSRQYIEAYRAMERAAEPTPLPEILDPARVEPLSLIPSDVLRTFASKKGKGIVALLLDSAHTWWFSRAIAGRNELKPFFEGLFRYDYDVRETESLLLLKPRLSSYAWGQRVDRRALSDWLRRILQRGYPRLEDYFALKRLIVRGYGWYGLESLYMELIAGEDALWWLYEADMRFLMSLTPAQLAQLRAGQELPLSALSPAQREQLTQEIYFGNARLTSWLEPEGDQPLAELVHVSYPDGLPPDAIIKLERSDPELGVFTVRRAGVWSGFQELMRIAAEMHWVQSERSESWMDEYSMRYYRERVERYQSRPLMPARRQSFILEVRLDKRHVVRLPSFWGEDYGDYELLNDGKPATIDTLPKELKEKLEKYKKSFGNPPKSDGY